MAEDPSLRALVAAVIRLSPATRAELRGELRLLDEAVLRQAIRRGLVRGRKARPETGAAPAEEFVPTASGQRWVDETT